MSWSDKPTAKQRLPRSNNISQIGEVVWQGIANICTNLIIFINWSEANPKQFVLINYEKVKLIYMYIYIYKYIHIEQNLTIKVVFINLNISQYLLVFHIFHCSSVTCRIYNILSLEIFYYLWTKKNLYFLFKFEIDYCYGILLLKNYCNNLNLKLVLLTYCTNFSDNNCCIITLYVYFSTRIYLGVIDFEILRSLVLFAFSQYLEK